MGTIPSDLSTTSIQSEFNNLESQHHGLNIMAASSNPILQRLDPPVTIPIFITNGIPATHFPIYVDPQSQKEYLICDLCGRELRLKSRKNAHSLVSHRGRRGCIISFWRQPTPSKKVHLSQRNQYTCYLYKLTKLSLHPAHPSTKLQLKYESLYELSLAVTVMGWSPYRKSITRTPCTNIDTHRHNIVFRESPLGPPWQSSQNSSCRFLPVFGRPITLQVHLDELNEITTSLAVLLHSEDRPSAGQLKSSSRYNYVKSFHFSKKKSINYCNLLLPVLSKFYYIRKFLQKGFKRVLCAG